MNTEDHETHDLVPDPTRRDLSRPQRTPGMTRSLLERIRQNYLDRQRQSRYITLTETAQTRTTALEANYEMRQAEEKLYTFEDKAELERLKTEAQRRHLTHAVDLEDLQAEVERQKLRTEIISQETKQTLLSAAASAPSDPDPSPGNPPPPVEDDLLPEEIQSLALKGFYYKTKSDRSWKDWQDSLLRDHSPWDAQKIIAEATRLYDEATR